MGAQACKRVPATARATTPDKEWSGPALRFIAQSKALMAAAAKEWDAFEVSYGRPRVGS